MGPSGEDDINSEPCAATIESELRLCPISIYNCSTNLPVFPMIHKQLSKNDLQQTVIVFAQVTHLDPPVYVFAIGAVARSEILAYGNELAGGISWMGKVAMH